MIGLRLIFLLYTLVLFLVGIVFYEYSRSTLYVGLLRSLYRCLAETNPCLLQ